MIKRREFLKQAGIVAAGIAAGACLPTETGFPGITGIDVATPEGSYAAMVVGYVDRLKHLSWDAVYVLRTPGEIELIYTSLLSNYEPSNVWSAWFEDLNG